ncbi:Protein kinase, putative [Hondaea fermentalgiana]|uniref:non-specific serine/threonine protein kinase n=1 Tax=Hondaea fermentalgiana TaxID=2315210 RepID=A0A2R5GHX6_9STRA|nr:Protein kinase, putative [Hondaea fermentalgiana]|eukprot:GBG29929.1 Protein kinase, putative [Hondaea fermentalgiana]
MKPQEQPLHLVEVGGTACVYKASNWEGAGVTGFVDGEFAVKVYREDCARAQAEAAREMRALHRLASLGDDSRFIINLVFVDKLSETSLPILGLDFCQGGDLYGLLSYGKLTEHDAKHYIVELASALESMRKAKVLHGDIKPENIGLTATGHLRVFDFGTARILENDKPVEHSAGTLLYASPEALWRRKCGYAADWWAMGVILFEMLYAQHAFESDSSDNTVDNIVRSRFSWPSKPRRSEAAMDFVERLLVVEQDLRMQTLKDCLAHPFLHDVDCASISSESWLPLKFNFAKFEQERLAQGLSDKSFF